MKSKFEQTDNPFMIGVHMKILLDMALVGKTFCEMTITEMAFEDVTSQRLIEMGNTVKGFEAGIAVARATFDWHLKKHDLNVNLIREAAAKIAMSHYDEYLGQLGFKENERICKVIRDSHMKVMQQFMQLDDYVERVYSFLSYKGFQAVKEQEAFKPQYELNANFIGLSPSLFKCKNGEIVVDWSKA